MAAPPTFDDVTLKHLDLIQGVVARLANNSFYMKGWALTVAGAFFAFSAKDLNPRIAAVGLLPVLAFWGLDGYFLSRERLYRVLYDAVRTGNERVPRLSMNYTLVRPDRPWYAMRGNPQTCWAAVWSRTLWPFYLAIFAVGVAVLITGVQSRDDSPHGRREGPHRLLHQSSSHVAAKAHPYCLPPTGAQYVGEDGKSSARHRSRPT